MYHATQGLAERLVIGLLRKMPAGGLRLEHADGRVRYFGKPGAPITASVILKDDREFFKRCAFYGNIGMGEAYTDGLWETNDIAAVMSKAEYFQPVLVNASVCEEVPAREVAVFSSFTNTRRTCVFPSV